MVEEQRYLISDAAKMVAVEAHVLRYWEEELDLAIGRTELGHRYYTRENIETFRNIKELKEKGLQLKAIRVILKGLEEKRREAESAEAVQMEGCQEFVDKQAAQDMQAETRAGADTQVRENVQAADAQAKKNPQIQVDEDSREAADLHGQQKQTKQKEETMLALRDNTQKLQQFEELVAGIVDKVVKENNEKLKEQIESSFSREMDYFVHMQEAREEERYRKLDEAIRAHQKGGKMAAATKEKGRFCRWLRR